MIINLNSSINDRDISIMDGFKIINSDTTSIFLPTDFFVLDEHFFGIQSSDTGIINVKKNITCNIFGARAKGNNSDTTTQITQGFIVRKNNIVIAEVNFRGSDYQSNFTINNISFMANDKIQFSYFSNTLGVPTFCEFYLKFNEV